MSFVAVLFLIFLVLKLVGVIAWSWWWVTAPLWVPLALSIVWATIVAVLGALFADKARKRVAGSFEDLFR